MPQSRLPLGDTHAIQHHRAHIASVLAERSEWHQRVVGVSFDGTGYGDDGTIWGGEFFVGSIADGFDAWRICAARRWPEATPPRNIRCRPPRVFWRSLTNCRT